MLDRVISRNFVEKETIFFLTLVEVVITFPVLKILKKIGEFLNCSNGSVGFHVSNNLRTKGKT